MITCKVRNKKKCGSCHCLDANCARKKKTTWSKQYSLANVSRGQSEHESVFVVVTSCPTTFCFDGPMFKGSTMLGFLSMLKWKWKWKWILMEVSQSLSGAHTKKKLPNNFAARFSECS